MKKTITVVFLFLGVCFIKGQTVMSFNLTFDHQALIVSNLDSSAAFYSEVLLLKETENKTKMPTIRWFSMGNGSQLHLITGNIKDITLNKGIHIALAVSDFEGFVKHLDEKKINYTDWPGEKHSPNTRADGVKQIYFQDPDGYWIEINDARK